ncbi:MAG TPA: 2-phospho-L-lactate guanylyltransferase [Marmoricola sp.]|nr:2-phospho-L-lactate guanylyltransferase [Marmoricola sp.]
MVTEAFVLLVPVKRLSGAKSRLALDTATSRLLMGAFARDAVAAALGCPRVAHVCLVTDEHALAESCGVGRCPDEGDGDLNLALARAAERARRRHPDLGVAAMCADLPCLTAADLSAALSAAGQGRWYVSDTEGTGTTLLAARSGVELHPQFGPRSAGRHRASGATPLAGGLATLRRDVDTREDLAGAITLGVGRHTEGVLDDLDLHATAGDVRR